MSTYKLLYMPLGTIWRLSGGMGLQTTTQRRWENWNIAVSNGSIQGRTRTPLPMQLQNINNASDQEPLPNCPPEAHYQIAESKKYYWDISAWLSQNRNDVALKDFLPKLKNHILGRLFGNNNKEFTQAQRNRLVFIHNHIY
ncbi:hypothetical protein OG21DRAFT_1486775 [Imleria badia]|nr:hypothetical protein OG21DRAFT_1486775 [Imleria badia]